MGGSAAVEPEVVRCPPDSTTCDGVGTRLRALGTVEALLSSRVWKNDGRGASTLARDAKSAAKRGSSVLHSGLWPVCQFLARRLGAAAGRTHFSLRSSVCAARERQVRDEGSGPWGRNAESSVKALRSWVIVIGFLDAGADYGPCEPYIF